MHLSVSSDARVSFSKAELLEMALQLKDGETLVLRIDLEDSYPLNDMAGGYIAREATSEDAGYRLNHRKPIVLETL